MVKTGSDLLKNPMSLDSNTSPQQNAVNTPFDKAFDILSITDGKLLELTTRTTPAIANAGQVSLAMAMRFGDGAKYIYSLYEQIQRQAVALGGKGRGEFVEITKYGSGVPPSFYEDKGSEKRSFIPMRDDRDGNTA